MQADQVLVGTNKTRRAYNGRMRELLGHRHPMPEAGEKLVCLRNDKKKGLLNGGTWTVHDVHADARRQTVDERHARGGARPQGRAGSACCRPSSRAATRNCPPRSRRDSDQFDYGYALTVHKAQGSQWDDVVLFDESFAFREHRDRWLYTGLTRAAERVTIVV